MGWYERDPNWLYPIRCPRLGGYPSGFDFYAGTTDDGRQVLLTEDGRALFFDADGNLIGQEHREPPKTEPHPAAEDRTSPREVGARRPLPEYLASEEGMWHLDHFASERVRIYGTFFQPWLTELHFRPGTIRVKRFGIPGERLGITDLSASDAAFLDDPNGGDLPAEERAERREEIQEWLLNGMFVLWCGRDLWLNGDGEIEST